MSKANQIKKQLLATCAAILFAFCLPALTGFNAKAAEAPAPETATGTVIDQYGDPMIGVTVMIPGTTKGTATDVDGNFSLAGVERGQTLNFSMIGCRPVDVKWEGTPLQITMFDDAQALSDVVVVGFGTQKRANLTGAVSTVTSSELANRPVSSVTDALQGLVPGLDILSSSLGGQLNGTRSMNIRGTGTIGAGSSVTPLILIDGMEGDINTINPQDIENISVLKDASASSIYGIRAAGGVILITTKKGKEGKISVTYSDSFRWSSAVNMPEMMDSYTWANYMNQASINGGGSAWFSDEKLAQFKASVENPANITMFVNPNSNRWEVWDLNDLLPTGNTDWLKEHFGKTSFSQEHNITVTGGSDRLNGYFSANILSQDGLLVYGDDNRQRYNITGRINFQITNWLLFGYNARWNRTNYDSPSVVANSSSNVLYHNFARYWPIVPVKDPNGHYVVESYVEALTNGGRYQTSNERFDQQFSFIVNPLEGLTINAEFNYRSRQDNTSRWGLQTYGYNVDNEQYPRNPDDWWAGAPEGTRVYEYNYRANYFNPNAYVTYEWSINDSNNFKVMAGFQSEWYRYKSFSAQNTGIMGDIPYLDTTDGTPTVSGTTASWSTAGWFGRINYNFKDRYLVEGNIRYDGTSRFRAGTRWSWSPSFSLGWNIANESFMEDQNWASTLKPRFSWGILGNQNTNSWYPTYSNMGYSPNGSNWLIPGQDSKHATASMPGLISSTLTWEKNRTWDIGIDWGFLSNRLTGSFDYYNRHTYDMVGPGVTLPGVLGAAVPNTNNLSMTAKGWELTISWRDRVGEFGYGITANLYDHTVTVDEYPNPGNSLNYYYPGEKLGDIWGYTTVGIAKTQEEMDAHLAQVSQSQLGSGWRAGDIMYADLDGDGVISLGEYTLDNHGDISIIGNETPRYNFGLTLDAQWKGFDIKLYFTGVGKRDYWASGNMFWGAVGIGKWQASGFKPQMDYFRPADTTDPLGPNLDSYYPAVNWNGGRNTQIQTRYLQNAAYCAFKNLTIGYTIPQEITRKAYIENLRIFFSAENIAKITSFTKMGDPELIEAYNSAYGFGKVYPLQKVFSFGVNVTF